MESLLLLPNGYQVAAIPVGEGNITADGLISEMPAAERQTIVLGVLHSDDTYVSAPVEGVHAQASDRVILYGRTRDLEASLLAQVRASRSSR